MPKPSIWRIYIRFVKTKKMSPPGLHLAYIYWSEVGGGQRPPPNGAYFPPARARREGGRPGARVSPSVRSSVRSDFCDFLEFLSINVMEFQ